MSPKEEHIIFDLDGTLIDSSKGILVSYKKAFEKCGIKPKLALKKEIIGPPLMETLSMLAGKSDLNQLTALKDTFQKSYDYEGFLLTTVFPGVNQMLNELNKEGFLMYIATNKRILPTKKILKALEWTDYFKGIYSLDSFDTPFISKDKVLGRLIKNHKIKNGAYYIGDTKEDLEVSEKNGLSFILAKWGYGETSFNNNLEVFSPKELVRYLLKGLG